MLSYEKMAKNTRELNLRATLSVTQIHFSGKPTRPDS